MALLSEIVAHIVKHTEFKDCTMIAIERKMTASKSTDQLSNGEKKNPKSVWCYTSFV